MVAYVSPEDHERVVAKKWQAKRGKRTWYARHVWREGKKLKGVYLHRFITGELDPSVPVDHRDSNGLNCTRGNLRSATGAQNTRNRRKPAIATTSVYKGVSWVTRRRRWCSQIKMNGKSKHLGHFDSERDAALAYDDAARAMHGAFALCNFPDI